MKSGRTQRTGAGPTPGTLRCLAALCGAVLLACDAAPRAPLEQATRAITAAHIDASGRYLADDARAGRHHASSEADSVVGYLVRQLERCGIQSAVQSNQLLGTRASCFAHHFGVPLQRLGKRTSLVLSDGRRHVEARPRTDFLPLVFSREEDVVGRILRLEALPESLDATPDLRGRVLWVPSTALPVRPGEPLDATYHHVARRLTTLGAAAVLFAGGPAWGRLAGTSYPSDLPPDVAAGWRSPRGARLNLNPSRLGSALQAAAWRVAPERTIPAVLLRPDLPWSPGIREVRLQVSFQEEISLGQNLLVGLGGGARRDEVVLVVAHYDHSGVNDAGEILNGANDNASGVAALLAVARGLSLVHERLDRSVLLAFVSAEVLGGQGLEVLLRDVPRLLGPVRIHSALILDAIGGEGFDMLTLQGAEEHPWLARILARHNHREALLAPALILEPHPRPRSPHGIEAYSPAHAWPHAASLDLLESAGIPTLLLNDGLDPLQYGQPEDDWERVDVDKVTRVARLVLRSLCDLAAPRGASRSDPPPGS